MGLAFSQTRVRSRTLNWDGLKASVKEDFPRTLAQLLAKSGMNKSQFAASLKVSNSTVGDWLKGKILPELGRLDDIARVFSVSRQELLVSPDDAAQIEVKTRDLDAILRELAASRGYELRPKKS